MLKLIMVHIREASYRDIPAIARVHVDTWRSTYSGIVPDEILAELSYEQREKSWQEVFDHAPHLSGFTYLAVEQSGQVVGFVDGGQERTNDQNYLGELNAIYILKSHQQKGLGRKLVQVAVQRLSQMNIHCMLAWVLEENPACKFYEALGGQRIQSKKIDMRGYQLLEIAYGWSDTSALLKHSQIGRLSN